MMKYRIIGLKDHGISVSSLGLGCMGMSEFYGETNREDSIATLRKAVELGVNFFDTADVYGFGENEKLVGEVLKEYRSGVVIATKCGIVRSKTDSAARGLNGSHDYIKAACEASLDRLGLDYIDLYYLHRIDPEIPIEESVGAMAELVREGKIRHIGLSEVDADTIRRAQAVHPVTAIQTEYSLWTRGVETNSVLDVCRELSIGFVAYSPLGRGFLTSTIKDPNLFSPQDFRKTLPRFQPGNFEANFKLVTLLQEKAKEKKCTPAQLALAWVLAKGDFIVPIPGTKWVNYLQENIDAVDMVKLTSEDVSYLDKISSDFIPQGERYTPAAMRSYNLAS